MGDRNSRGEAFALFTELEVSLVSDLRFFSDGVFGVFGVFLLDADFDCDRGVLLADFLALLDFTRGVTVREADLRVGVRERDLDLDLRLPPLPIRVIVC